MESQASCNVVGGIDVAVGGTGEGVYVLLGVRVNVGVHAGGSVARRTTPALVLSGSIGVEVVTTNGDSVGVEVEGGAVEQAVTSPINSAIKSEHLNEAAK